MKLKQYLIIMSLMAASTVNVFAQKDSTFLPKAYQSLKAYTDKNPVEKVYLQLDKTCYAAGDDIWFKAYVIAGAKHALSAISGVLNVELIDDKGVVEQSIKLPLVSGLTWGDFKLADTASDGNYRIRAYTNWMRNAGTEYFYDKTIVIGNSIMQSDPVVANRLAKQTRRKVANGKSTASKVKVQFLPEGGNLVYNITSQVAFKAVGEDGYGKEVNGVVIDDQNHEVAKFSSRHLGMGTFSFLPVTGRTYKAKITYADSTANWFDLPAPAAEGYVLHINNLNPANVIVQVEASAGLLTNAPGVYLVAQSGGEIRYAAENKSMSAAFTAVIPKSKFPTGIAQFTLFSKGGEPLNERLVFIQNNDQLKLSITTPDKVFAPGEKMKIGVCVTDAQNKTAFGNFSVSVIDETKMPANVKDENSIFSDLLLTSDIKGYVENPNYYFTEVNGKTTEDLDALMLTQGYHRFEWKHILKDSITTPLYQPETSLAITGRVRSLGNRPQAKAKVSIMSSSAGFFALDTVADDKGYFAFRNLQFKDSTKFVVQSKKKNNNIKIELDSDETPETLNKYLPGPPFIKDSLSVYLVNSKKTYDQEVKYGVGAHNTLLREVKIKAFKPKLTNSANLNGPGEADQVLMAKAFEKTGCGSIAECLIGKLTGVWFQYDDRNFYYFPVTNVDGKTVSMIIKVDGFDIKAEYLTTIPVEFVESVEVLRTSSYTSAYGAGGVILINTKQGGYGNGISYNSVATAMPKGYYKARVFYSPQYDDPKTNRELANLRTTIYWNPNVFTDKDGNITFDYFNAGNKGRYKMIIEGIDGGGKLGRGVYEYRVE